MTFPSPCDDLGCFDDDVPDKMPRVDAAQIAVRAYRPDEPAGVQEWYDSATAERIDDDTVIRWRDQEVHHHCAWTAGFHDGRRRDLIIIRYDGTWWPYSGPFGGLDNLVRGDPLADSTSFDDLLGAVEDRYGKLATFSIGVIVPGLGPDNAEELSVELWLTAVPDGAKTSHADR